MLVPTNVKNRIGVSLPTSPSNDNTSRNKAKFSTNPATTTAMLAMTTPVEPPI